MDKQKIVDAYEFFKGKFAESIAIELTKEWGLFERTEFINANQKSKGLNGNAATEKQISFIKVLQGKGDIGKDIDLTTLTKKDANELISKATA